MQQWRVWRRIGHFRSDADLKDELQAHFELSAEDHAGGGLPVCEARRRARLQLGPAAAIVEAIRDQDLATAIESWYRDLVLGLRTLRSAPVFCLTAILTIGLGIGANTAVFSVLYGLLLRSLPVTNPGRLVNIGLAGPTQNANDQGQYLTYGMVQELSHKQHSFTEVSAWNSTTLALKDRQGTLRLYDAGLVSGNAFPLLGMKPYRGRLIAPGDDVRGSSRAGWPVVLSYGFWKDRFGSDPHIIGREITGKDTSLTVVGVAPPEFQGVWPGVDPKLYLPLQYINVIAGRDVLNRRDSTVGCAAIARLKPGVSIKEASAEIATYRNQLLDTIPLQYRHLPDFEKATIRLRSARTGLPTPFGYTYSRPLFLLQGLVAIVLVLCCVNVGGLMMSKVYARQREFAVRIAIGAARWRLIRQYLTESLVIGVAGALLGAAGAWYGTGFLLRFFRHPMMFEGMSLRPDSMVFWVTGLLALLTTLFFGTLPAWRAGLADAGTLLRSRTVFGGKRQIAGRAFVPAQVALSVALVTVATLLSQSLIHLHGEHVGFDADHVTIQTPPFDMLPQRGDPLLDVYQRMVDRIEQAPGIRAAAVTWYTPMTGDQRTARFEPVESSAGSPKSSKLAFNAVGPGYFRAMRTAIISGREFAKNERRRTVCIVNESASHALFPHDTALGQYVRSNDTKEFPQAVACRVIGIAQDAKFANLRDAAPPTIYFPLSKETLNDAGVLVFLINAATKAEAIAGYGAALEDIAPSVPLVLFVTLKEQIDAALGSQRLITAMSDFFAVLALLLSALGLYGLLSSSVAQRTGEIGVRMALGARRATVLRMILEEGLRLLVVGVLLSGAVLALVLRFVQAMLYGVSAFDPLTWLAMLLLLTIVALFAGIWPALRAASVDPIVALRAE